MKPFKVLLILQIIHICKIYALDYPFASNTECTDFSSEKYELVADATIERILQEIKQFKCGIRQLQFLQYYATKSHKKICFVYAKSDKDQAFRLVFPGNGLNISNLDGKLVYIQIPKEASAIPACIIVREEESNFIISSFNTPTSFNQKGISFEPQSMPLNKIFKLNNDSIYAYCIGHELYHVCSYFCGIDADNQQQRYDLFRYNNFSAPDNIFCNNGDDSLQEAGAFFIGEFDYLQEIFGRFVLRCYVDDFKPQKIKQDAAFIFKKLRNHQLDSFFIRPKFYEDINMRNCPQQVANTIAFLQQEDFLLEHFALEVPSDGNDAIWAVMQAYLRFNIDPEELLKDADMQTKMIAWRNMLAAKFQNIPEVHTRFSGNHHRIKVEDFTYIAQTINRDVIVIEPEGIQFKITVFNDEGTYYSMNKLPKLEQKTLYIYYNGYNHYQPLLLASRLDATISLKAFLDQPANTLSDFLVTKTFYRFLETRFLNDNYRIEDVPGDGNCGIYAILRGLGLEINQTNNLRLRNEIFLGNHRMQTDRAWLGMEDLPHVATYLQNTYQRDLIIVNASPVNPNITNVIVPDDHIYTRYVNGHWVSYNSLNAAINPATDTKPPVILLYTNHHFQAVVPKRPRRATIGNDGDFIRVRLRKGSV